MQKHMVTIVKNFNLPLVVLFVALIGVQTLNTGGSAMAQTASARKADLESSVKAKCILAGLGSRDFKRVKDARMRDAGGRALAALRAIADNTSKTREAALADDFERTIKDLKALPGQPTAADTRECDQYYELCMEICKEIGSDCKLCGIGQNGCYLTKLVAEATKLPNDPTP